MVEMSVDRGELLLEDIELSIIPVIAIAICEVFSLGVKGD